MSNKAHKSASARQSARPDRAAPRPAANEITPDHDVWIEVLNRKHDAGAVCVTLAELRLEPEFKDWNEARFVQVANDFRDYTHPASLLVIWPAPRLVGFDDRVGGFTPALLPGRSIRLSGSLTRRRPVYDYDWSKLQLNLDGRHRAREIQDRKRAERSALHPAAPQGEGDLICWLEGCKKRNGTDLMRGAQACLKAVHEPITELEFGGDYGGMRSFLRGMPEEYSCRFYTTKKPKTITYKPSPGPNRG